MFSFIKLFVFNAWSSFFLNNIIITCFSSLIFLHIALINISVFGTRNIQRRSHLKSMSLTCQYKILFEIYFHFIESPVYQNLLNIFQKLENEHNWIQQHGAAVLLTVFFSKNYVLISFSLQFNVFPCDAIVLFFLRINKCLNHS